VNGSQGFPREESKIEGKTSRGDDAEKFCTAVQGTIIGGVSTRSGRGGGMGANSGGLRRFDLDARPSPLSTAFIDLALDPFYGRDSLFSLDNQPRLAVYIPVRPNRE